MENASNALIIAATILIALMILAIGVYLSASHARVQESYTQRLTVQEVEKFNSKFLAFDNRGNITAQEIVTIKEFADQFDAKYGTTTNISVIGIAYTDAISFIQNSSPIINADKSITYKHYKCNKDTDTDIQYDPETGRVTAIKFTKNW